MKSLKQLKEEYTDLLEGLNDNLKAQLKSVANLKNNGILGVEVVYILKQKGTDNYKIGFSTNYQQRKNYFDIKLPFEIEEILIHETENYRKVEAELHKFFKAQRLNDSEFFKLSEEQVSNLKNTIRDIEDSLENEDIEPKEVEDKDAEIIQKTRDLMTKLDLGITEVSVSFLQRKLAIGFARASRIKDRLLEELKS